MPRGGTTDPLLSSSPSRGTRIGSQVLGYGSQVRSAFSIAIGMNAKAGAAQIGSLLANQRFGSNIAIGSALSQAAAPQALTLGCIAIGSSMQRDVIGGVDIAGPRAGSLVGSSEGCIAIGSATYNTESASATGDRAIAIGSGATTAGATALALGNGATAAGNSATSVGKLCVASNSNSVSVGTSTNVTGSNATGLGYNAQATSTESTALGGYCRATTGTQAIAIGGGVSSTAAPFASAQGAIAIGGSNHTSTNGARASGITSIAIGSGAGNTEVGASATQNYAIAVGVGASAGSASSLALGPWTLVSSGISAIAIGGTGLAGGSQPAANATAQGAIAIGNSNGAVVNGSRASATNAVAIGSGDATIAGASATHADAIVLGRGVASTNTRQLNIGPARAFLGCPTTAPASGDLIASQTSFSVNEAGNLFTVTVKYADGTTVKSGTVALV
jgi:hypothetical protein